MHIGVPDRRIENNTPNEFPQPFLAEKRPDVFGHSGVSVLLVFLFRILSVNLIEILRVNLLSVRSAIETPDEVRVRFVFREFMWKVLDQADRYVPEFLHVDYHLLGQLNHSEFILLIL